MREAIGSTKILFIIVVIIIAIMMLLAASIGYTKAFKARNAIVNIIQKNGAYGMNAATVMEESKEEIRSLLSEMGYKVNVGTSNTCPDIGKVYKTGEKQGEPIRGERDTDYAYCVYHIENDDGSQYYRILTYMYFEMPVFGRNDRFAIPLYADTATFYKLNGVEEG